MVNGYSKSRVVHRTKAKAEKEARKYRARGTPCRLVRVADGWRVDKKY